MTAVMSSESFGGGFCPNTRKGRKQFPISSRLSRSWAWWTHLSALPAASAPLLFLSACIGFMSADPALAQANKPASDVVVVNTSTAPVPVSVVNPPSGEPPFDPVALDSFMDYRLDVLRTTREFHTVPAGKWLVVEQVTFSSMEVPTWPAFFLLLVTDPPGDPFSRVVEHTMAVDDRQTDAATMTLRQFGTKMVKIYAGPGAKLKFLAVRTNPAAGFGTVRWTVSGRYVSAP
jgi:hypothetical protein